MLSNIKIKKVVLLILVGLIILPLVSYVYMGFVFLRTFENFCYDTIEVTAWVDINGNSKWDAEEPTLPLVDIVADKIPADVSIKTRVSGSDGIVPVKISSQFRDLFSKIPSPTCRHLKEVTIQPIAPEGYTPLDEEGKKLKEGLAFGFQPKPNTILPIFQPSLTCQSITLGRNGGIEKVLPQEEGTLFLGRTTPSWDYFLLEHQTETGEMHRWDINELYGEEQKIIDIEQGEDDILWTLSRPYLIAQLEYKSSTWNMKSLPNPFSNVTQIATDNEGRLWAVSTNGIARWNETNQNWIYFENDEEEVAVQASSFKIMPSGALLVGNPDILMLGLIDESAKEIVWQSIASSLPRPDLFVVDDANRLWFNQMSVFFDVEKEEWYSPKFQSKIINYSPRIFIGSAEITGDSLWIGASEGVLFFVEHYDQSDWTQWPQYKMDFRINDIVLGLDNTVWVTGYNALTRCQSGS